MRNLELRVTSRDWLSILLIGILFSTFLSILEYHLLELSLIEGGIFGIVLGFCITFFSLFFITTMNRYLLPNISQSLWNTSAALFSFLSGFLGTLFTYGILHFTAITFIEHFDTHPYQTSSIIGSLTYLIGLLVYRFVKIRNEKDQSHRLFIKSRLSSLETQLNPHFLFNALNSLTELIHQDPHKAEETIVKISTFLRNTMGEKSLIPLRAELKKVRDYIDLENIRFNGAIALSVEVESSALVLMVPKFSIQLLAENGIKHGLQSPSTDFTISIHIVHIHNSLHIRVSNNGKPITNPSFGIGLSNLQERLSHLCHGKLTIERTDIPTYLIELKDCNAHFDR